MKSIGVLTFHRASNYGAVLQAWALQEAMRRLGVSAEVVDYRSPALEAHYQPDILATLFSPRKLGIALLRNGHHLDRRHIFREFVAREIPVSAVSYGPADLSIVDSRYRALLAGSDQVWNFQIAGFDRAYFLDFVSGHGRRLSYAASLGLESIPEEHREEYRRLLSGISAMTVREVAGSAVVEGLIGTRPPVVLDPTLLFGRSDWHSLASRGKPRDKPYLLLYLLAETPGMVKYARTLAKKRGLELVYISQRLFRPRGMTVLSEATPYDFLRLMAGADAVVTNSFHGLAFSLNFGRDLHFDYLPEPSRVNSRLRNLSNQFGLDERQIQEGSLLLAREESAILSSLQLLEAERKRSLRLLGTILEAAQ